MNKTFHMILLSLFIAQSLALYIIEGMLPIPFIAPGAKLGLSNLITLIALYTLPRKRDVFLILFVRVLLSSLFGGGPNALLYSAAGAALSFLAMIAVKTIGRDHVSIIGVSTAGAMFHNLGQVLAASIIVQNSMIMLYLPVLSLAGIGTGLFIGVAANFIIGHIKKLPLFKKIKQTAPHLLSTNN